MGTLAFSHLIFLFHEKIKKLFYLNETMRDGCPIDLQNFQENSTPSFRTLWQICCILLFPCPSKIFPVM